MKKIISIFLVLTMLSLSFVGCKLSDKDEENSSEQTTEEVTTKEKETEEDEELSDEEKEAKYNEALDLIKSKNYVAARKIFVELGKYKDSKKQLSYFRYVPISSTFLGDENSSITFSYDSKNLI